MALVTLAPMQLMLPPQRVSTAPTLAATGTLTGTGNRYAAMIQAPATGTISDIGFQVFSVTTGGNIDVRLETLDLTTGFPSGTLFGTNTNKTVDISGGAGWYKATLTAGAIVTKGDFICVVIDGLSSGVAPVFTLQNFTDGNTNGTPDFPNYASFAASAWSMTTSCITISVEYNGTCNLIPWVWPISAVNTHTFNSGSSPNVYANRFQMPVPCRFTGCWLWGDFDGDFAINLYGSDGVTVLSTLTVDKDVPGAATGAGNCYFDMPVATLLKNTSYWLGVAPNSVTSMSVYSMDVSTAYILGQAHGAVTQAFNTASSPSGTGSWTETTTRKLFIEPRFDQFLDGSSGNLVDGGLVD